MAIQFTDNIISRLGEGKRVLNSKRFDYYRYWHSFDRQSQPIAVLNRYFYNYNEKQIGLGTLLTDLELLTEKLAMTYRHCTFKANNVYYNTLNDTFHFIGKASDTGGHVCISLKLGYIASRHNKITIIANEIMNRHPFNMLDYKIEKAAIGFAYNRQNDIKLW